MQEITLEYLKTRQQFGRPIGQFQALQHRAVDMLIALEQARSMAMFAAIMSAETDAAERRRAISAAKTQIGRSGKPYRARGDPAPRRYRHDDGDTGLATISNA